MEKKDELFEKFQEFEISKKQSHTITGGGYWVCTQQESPETGTRSDDYYVEDQC